MLVVLPGRHDHAVRHAERSVRAGHPLRDERPLRDQLRGQSDLRPRVHQLADVSQDYLTLLNCVCVQCANGCPPAQTCTTGVPVDAGGD